MISPRGIPVHFLDLILNDFQNSFPVLNTECGSRNKCFNLKLEAYAQLCNRSLSTFKRDFQKIYHITPGDWLLEQRLNHSFRLLRDNQKSISEAAFESGFESVSHFSRSFKKSSE